MHMLELYKNIKKLRKERGWSQEELSEKMGYSGKSMISQIERGKVDLTQSRIQQFADVFEISPDELMGTIPNENYDKDLFGKFKTLMNEEHESGLNLENIIGLRITSSENELIEAYRQAPEPTKKAIDVLLGIGDEEK